MTASKDAETPGLLALMRQNIWLPLIAGVVLAILAPFNTDAFTTIWRLVFWIGCTIAGGTGALIARVFLRRMNRSIRAVWIALAMSIGATLAVSPFVLTIFSSQSPTSIALSLFYIWVISITISAVGILSDRAMKSHERDKTDDNPLRPPLLDRLPPQFRNATLFALNSEDHYVRIFTDVGNHLILIRLSDAEDLAYPVKGMKPHRSWWVAEAGVDQISKAGGKILIQLKSGETVPVSRTGAKTLRAQKWM